MKKVYKSFIVYLSFDFSSKALPVLLTPILAYYLTSSEFGLVSNYLVLLNIFGPLVALSTYSALTVFYFKNINSINSLFSNLTYLILLLTGILLLVVIIFQNQIIFYTKLSLVWVILGLFAAMLTSINNLYTSYLRMAMKAILFGIIQFGEGMLTFIFTIIFVVVFPFNWEGRIISIFLGSFIAFCFCLIYFHQNKILVFEKIEINRVKQFLFWGIPLIPHTLSFWIKSGIDRLIITNFVGLAANGIYSIAFTFAGVINLMTSAFFNIYAPYIYNKLTIMDSCEEKEKKRNADHLVRNTYYYGLFVFTICLILYFLLPFLIRLFFRGDYLLSIALMPWVYIMVFFGGLYAMISSVLFHRNKTKQLGTITFSLSILQAGLSYILVRHNGLTGVLLSGTIVSILNFFLVLFLVNKEYNFQWNPFRSEIFNLTKFK